MSDSRDGSRRGPVDDYPWPSRLTAYVVKPGAAPRVHGYDVLEDLILHYSVSELMLLAQTGELPSRQIGRTLEVVMGYLSATSVAEAPAHAAGLARLIGGASNGVIGTGAITLAEQAHRTVSDHQPLLEWLDRPTSTFPKEFRARDDEERATVARIAAALERGGEVPLALQYAPTPVAAILCTLHHCGLRRPAQLETIWVVSRLAVVCSEAFAVTPRDFRSYPMDLPPYRYHEDDDDRE